MNYAGPMLADDEQTMVGSIIVLEADDRTAAESFARNDPYRLAELFADVEIRPFKQVLPAR